MSAKNSKLENFIDQCWKEILSAVQDAAVYIDHAAAECLHWYTGDKAYLVLKNAGAISVHELAMYNFRYVTVNNTKKAVIISTSPDPAFYRRTIKMIMEKNTFSNCTIICGADSTVINYTSSLSTEDNVGYTKLQQDVKSWMNSKDPLQECFVDVIFRPIFVALINQNVFVTPPFGGLMTPINDALTEDLATGVNYLVNSLHNLFGYLNLKEDIYSIGKLSDYVAEKLETLPAAVQRRNNFTGTIDDGVSLVLMDRTLDLCTATSFNSESMLGRILSSLPRLPHHYNDVAVNMAPLLNDTHGNEPSEIPGCLATTNKTIIDMLIHKKQKEVLLTANKLLTDASSIKSSPKAKITTRITPHSLEKMIQKICTTDNFDIISTMNKELQIILAIIQALKSDKMAQIELLISLEKLILQNIAASRDSSSVLAQVSNIIKTRNTRGLDTEKLLALLVYVYALTGTQIRFSSQQEDQLKEAIAEAITEDIKSLNEKTSNSKMTVYQQTLLLLGVTDDNLIKETSEKITARIMWVLHAVAEQRATLHQYTSLMTQGAQQEMVQCCGLLEQLVTDILHPEKYALHDLHHRPQSLISAGFNLLLKGRAKCHPADNSWIIIYVIGGITPEEIRRVQELVLSQTSNCHVTLAGSRLLTPLDIVDEIIIPAVNE